MFYLSVDEKGRVVIPAKGITTSDCGNGQLISHAQSYIQLRETYRLMGRTPGFEDPNFKPYEGEPIKYKKTNK